MSAIQSLPYDILRSPLLFVDNIPLVSTTPLHQEPIAYAAPLGEDIVTWLLRLSDQELVRLPFYVCGSNFAHCMVPTVH